MRDVARAAGVSTASVSHAVNNKGRLDAETRRRILAVAAELGYQVHPQARALRTGDSSTIGLVTSLPADQDADRESRLAWYTQTALAAASECLLQGYALVMVPPIGQTGWVYSLPLDGVLVIDPDPADGIVEILAERGLPVVVVGGVVAGSVASTSLNRDGAVQLAMSHLLASGARCPALVVDNSAR